MCDWATTKGTSDAFPLLMTKRFETDTCLEQTVIVFDWDDTLCPTFAMTDLGITPQEPPLMSVQPRLLELARAAIDLQTKVTNAGEGWVETSRSACPTCYHRSDSARSCPLGHSGEMQAPSVKETVSSKEQVETKTVDHDANVRTPSTHTVLANSWMLLKRDTAAAVDSTRWEIGSEAADNIVAWPPLPDSRTPRLTQNSSFKQVSEASPCSLASTQTTP